MWKIGVIRDATKAGCNKLNDAKTSASINNTEPINDDCLKIAKSKINILVVKKQIENVNCEIYYISEREQNFNHSRQNQYNIFTG